MTGPLSGRWNEAIAKSRPQPWTVEEFLAFEAEEPER
jgi:hypothetical protein